MQLLELRSRAQGRANYDVTTVSCEGKAIVRVSLRPDKFIVTKLTYKKEKKVLKTNTSLLEKIEMSKGALQNWLDANKDIVQETKNKKENSGKKCAKIADGETILEVSKILNITDGVFKFPGKDKNGKETMTSVQRFFYHFVPENKYDENESSTWALLVPKSVHFDILDLVAEYGDKLKAVKIKKSGSSTDTEYKVFPQLK